jgi:hypothetical protein
MKDKKITLVTIDTAFHALTNLAVNRTLAQFDVDEVLIFTDRPKSFSVGKIVEIASFVDKETYNSLVLSFVREFIGSSHALFVQYDGFVLNRDRWHPSFLSYDYIGAPWPNMDRNNVGNGGFSLRSRRLVDEVANYAGERSRGEPEDYFICNTIRPKLEARIGARYASEEVALSFSFESPGQPTAAFGFHGVFNMALAYRDDPETFFENAPAELILNRGREIFYGLRLLDQQQRSRFVAAWVAAYPNYFADQAR